MEVKDLLPVLGIILGWVLSELSKYFRESNVDRKLINRIVSELLFVRYETYQFIVFSKGAIEIHGYGQDAERERQRLMNKHLISLDSIVDSYEDLFDSIASYDPILAKKFIHQITILSRTQEIKLNEVSKIPEIYEDIISDLNIVHNKSIECIDKVILKLSFKSSLVLWISIRKELKKDMTSLGNWSKSVNERILKKSKYK